MISNKVAAAFSSAILCLSVTELKAGQVEAGERSKPYEYFSNPWTVVGLKDYRDGTRVAPDGTLLLGEGIRCRFLVGESYSPLTADIVRTLEKDTLQLSGLFRPKPDIAEFDVALPVVHLVSQAKEELRYEFIIFASPLNPADKSVYDGPVGSENYLNHVCIHIQSDLPNPAKAPVGISLSRAISAPQAIEPSGETERSVCRDDKKLALLMGLPKGTSTEKVGDSLRWKVSLEEKGAAELYLVIPHVPLATGESLQDVPVGRARPDREQVRVVPGSPAYFGVAREGTRRFWRELLGKGTLIGVPEEKPSLTYYASLAYTFIGRDLEVIKGREVAVIKPGEGFYDEFYLRDGAFQTHALDLAGFPSEAKESLAHSLNFQNPDGQFISQRGELDGNGQAIWALYAHYALTGDVVWLNQVYSSASRAVSWLERSRQSKLPLDSPYFGILFASIADGENLMQTPKHIVGYDFWNLRGADCAARLAEARGDENDARDFRRLFERYKACVENALTKAGADWFPPSYEGVGTSWGNLTMLHPTPLFDAADPRVTGTLDRVRAGFIEGTIRWGEEEKGVIHPYMSTYVTNSEIVRGEQEKAVDHFYHFLAHTTSTHGFPEGVYYKTRTAWNDTVPHLWAAAQYIILLRNMLLREDGEVLHLLPCVPVAWLRPGKKIVVLRAPTLFGEAGFAVNATEGGCEVRFTWPRRRKPERLLLHVPPGTTVKRVLSGEDEEIEVENGAVALPRNSDRVRIEWTLPPREKDRAFEDYAAEYEKNSPLPSKRNN